MIMPSPNSDKIAAVGSMGFHLLFFFILGIAGIFTVKAVVEEERPIDVVVYEVDGGGPSAPAQAAPPPPPEPPTPEDIVVEDKTLPLTPEPIPEEKKEETPTPPKPYVPPSPKGVVGGTGTNTSATTGTGDGMGTGLASGGGTGEGQGTGSGNAIRPKVPPRLISAVQPQYPENLRRQNIEGSVRIRLLVGTDGSVENVEVIESSGYDEMDEAAVNAIYEYSFSPAENTYGDAVRCAITTGVKFQLN